MKGQMEKGNKQRMDKLKERKKEQRKKGRRQGRKDIMKGWTN